MFEKQANLQTMYGPLIIDANGKSMMEFEVHITNQKVRKGKNMKPQVDDVGTWQIGAPGMLVVTEVSAAKALKSFSTKPVYKIVIVEVRLFSIHIITLH